MSGWMKDMPNFHWRSIPIFVLMQLKPIDTCKSNHYCHCVIPAFSIVVTIMYLCMNAGTKVLAPMVESDLM